MCPRIPEPFTPRMSARQLFVALGFGVVAAMVLFTGLSIPLGHGLMAEPSEVFVTLGSALSGPFGGLVIGLLQGIVYAPERNVPSHMLAGFIWGAWYFVLYRWSLGEGRGKWTRAALWAVSIPVYYYLLLLPLHLLIASATLGVSFVPLYIETGTGLLPEVAFTLLVTTLVLLVIPEKWAAPIG